MNFLGIDILQLIIYICVAASFVVVIYILKLTRKRNKTKTEPKPSEESPDKTIKQLIALIDKMWSHSVGLDSCSSLNPQPTPSKRRTRRKPEPTPSHSIQKIDEDTYTPTEQDKELLGNIKKQLGEKE